MTMGKDEENKKDEPKKESLFNIEILGLNLNDLIKRWVGEPDALFDPNRLEEVKQRIEDNRTRFEKLRDDLQTKTKGAVKVDYNVRIRTLDGGELNIGSAHDPSKVTRPSATRPDTRAEEAKAAEVKEPMYDVFDKEDRVELVIEVPGVSEQELETEINDRTLRLNTTDQAKRKYRLEVELPATIIKEETKKTHRNGILTISIMKKHQ